jgi:hypothetical protein
MNKLTLKRGSSFGATVRYTPDAAGPQTLHSVSIASQVRTPGGQLLADLSIALAQDGLSFNVTAPSGTAAWPLGIAHWDIKFTAGGSVFYTETLTLELTREVTA